MNSKTTLGLSGFDEKVLERWGLKPTAMDTITRARETGAITPQEISEMISSPLAKDRQKMAETLQEIKKILQSLNIAVTFNIVTHNTTVINHPAQPVAPAQKPETRPEAEKLSAAPSPSPFLNAQILADQGLMPEAFEILSKAKMRGQISPPEIRRMISESISKDTDRLRTTMRWITQFLGVINVRIVIGSEAVATPKMTRLIAVDGRSAKTAHSSLMKTIPPAADKFGDAEGMDLEPTKGMIAAMEKEEQGLEKELKQEESFSSVPSINIESDSVNSYYRYARSHAFLNKNEELELARRWHMHQDHTARNTIVLHNLRLVMKIAKHYMGRGLDYDDLVQEGNMGLMIASERFDPEMGCRFTTYAVWWIRQSISRAIQNFKDIIRMPVYVHEARYKILKIACDLGMELQREPTVEEIAAKAGEDTAKVKKILHVLHVPVISLEDLAYGLSDESETTIRDIFQDLSYLPPSTMLEAKEGLEAAAYELRKVLAAVNTLDVSDNAKTAFKMYYALEGNPEGATHESIAPTFGVTRERVRQLKNTVWEKLAKHGINLDDQGLLAMIERVHRFEDMVSMTADVSSPVEGFVLEAVTLAFQEEASAGNDIIPTIAPESERPTANISNVKPGKSNPEEIIRIVSETYGATPELVLGDKRPNDIVWVRWVCTYIMREKLKSSFVSIGQALRYNDHTTAIYGYKEMIKAMEKDPGVKDEVEKIASLCKQPEPETIEDVQTEQKKDSLEKKDG